jgi:hypothetical protein
LKTTEAPPKPPPKPSTMSSYFSKVTNSVSKMTGATPGFKTSIAAGNQEACKKLYLKAGKDFPDIFLSTGPNSEVFQGYITLSDDERLDIYKGEVDQMSEWNQLEVSLQASIKECDRDVKASKGKIKEWEDLISWEQVLIVQRNEVSCLIVVSASVVWFLTLVAFILLEEGRL